MAKEEKERLKVKFDQENAHIYYADATHLTSTVFDFSFYFGKSIVNPAKPSERTNTYEVLVQMSPQHAKVINIMLTEQIEKYEKNIGPISISLNSNEIEKSV